MSASYGNRFEQFTPQWWLYNLYQHHHRWLYAALVHNAEEMITTRNNRPKEFNEDMLWDFLDNQDKTWGMLGVDQTGVAFTVRKYWDSIGTDGNTDAEENLLVSMYIQALLQEDPHCARYHEFIQHLLYTNIEGV